MEEIYLLSAPKLRRRKYGRAAVTVGGGGGRRKGGLWGAAAADRYATKAEEQLGADSWSGSSHARSITPAALPLHYGKAEPAHRPQPIHHTHCLTHTHTGGEVREELLLTLALFL